MPNNNIKDKVVLIILSYILGIFGVDRMYLGCWISGFFKLITFGGLGIWYLVDLLLIIINAYSRSNSSVLCSGYSWNPATLDIAQTIATIIIFLFVLKIIFSFIFWVFSSTSKIENQKHQRKHHKKNISD